MAEAVAALQLILAVVPICVDLVQKVRTKSHVDAQWAVTIDEVQLTLEGFKDVLESVRTRKLDQRYLRLSHTLWLLRLRVRSLHLYFHKMNISLENPRLAMWQNKEVITNYLESQLNTTRDVIDKCSEAYCDAMKDVSALEPVSARKFAGADKLPEEEPPVKRKRLSKGGPPAKRSEAYCDAMKEVSALEKASARKLADVPSGAYKLHEEEPPVKRARLSKGGPPAKRRRVVPEKEGRIPASRDKEGVIDEKWLEDRVKMEENEILSQEGAA